MERIKIHGLTKQIFFQERQRKLHNLANYKLIQAKTNTITLLPEDNSGEMGNLSQGEKDSKHKRFDQLNHQWVECMKTPQTVLQNLLTPTKFLETKQESRCLKNKNKNFTCRGSMITNHKCTFFDILPLPAIVIHVILVALLPCNFLIGSAIAK